MVVVADGLQVTYLPGNNVVMRGSKAGTLAGVVTMAPGEQIVQVFGRSGTLIDAIGFKTSYGRSLGPWGGTGGGDYQVNGVVVGFFGGTVSGNIGALGVYTSTSGRIKYPNYWGSYDRARTGWDDGPNYSGWIC